jgi:hypothetical protein
VWRKQYEINHRTVSESPRAMLQDLENTKKVFNEKYNKNARAVKAKVATAPKADGGVPRKLVNGGSSGGSAPKKGQTTKYCKHCKANGGLFTTHGTIKCHRCDKDDKQKYKPAKPFDSAKKPWKKGDEDSGEMAYLTKKVEKLKKKLKKTMITKLAKKRAHDFSDSDSNSD